MGGAAMGVESTESFTQLLAVDNDEHAEKCFRLNFPAVPFIRKSITKKTKGSAVVRYARIKSDNKIRKQVDENGVDYVHASPPCQGNSDCGKRDVTDERNMLYFETLRLINEIRPHVFTIENVPGQLKGIQYRRAFNELLRLVNSMGYQYEVWQLNALHYGVPQKRWRVFMVGWRNDLQEAGIRPEMPTPDMEGAENFRIKNIIPNLSFVHPGQFFKNPETGKRVLPHSAEGFTPTLVKSSPPIFYFDDGVPERRANIQEGLMMMSFPHDYKLYSGEVVGKSGKKRKCGLSENWARIGNAVPPKMMEAVALAVVKMLDSWYERKSQ